MKKTDRIILSLLVGVAIWILLTLVSFGQVNPWVYNGGVPVTPITQPYFGSFTGNGSGLTNVNAAQNLTGGNLTWSTTPFNQFNFNQLWMTNTWGAVGTNGQLLPMPSGIWPSSCQVTNGLTNLFCNTSPFKPYMTNWVVMIQHAGSPNVVVVNTNYPIVYNMVATSGVPVFVNLWGVTLSTNTSSFATTNNCFYDLIGMVTNVLNPSNVIMNVMAGVTTNTPFILAPNALNAFSNAVNFVCTNTGGANELDVQDGIYGFWGNWLNTTAWTNANTSLISIPHIGSKMPEKTVRIKGQTPASLFSGGGGPRSMPNGAQGVVFAIGMMGTNNNLYSFLDTRDFSGQQIPFADADVIVPAPFAAPLNAGFPQDLPAAAMPYSDIQLDIENMAFVCPYDCNFACLNLLGDAKTILANDDLAGGPPDSLNGIGNAIGGTNSWAVLLPGSFNDNKQLLYSVNIQGFYNGEAIGGNTVHINPMIADCWNAVVAISSADVDEFYGLGLSGDKNYFTAWNSMQIDVQDCFPQDSIFDWASQPNLVIATNSALASGHIVYKEEAMSAFSKAVPVWGNNATTTLQVDGYYMQNGGVPRAAITFNTPVVTSQQVFSNGVSITGPTVLNGIVAFQNGLFNNEVQSGQWNFSGINYAVSSMFSDQEANVPPFALAWYGRNDFLSVPLAYLDQSGNLWVSNLVITPSVAYTNNPSPINIQPYSGTATNWVIEAVGGALEKIATNNGAGTLMINKL